MIPLVAPNYSGRRMIRIIRMQEEKWLLAGEGKGSFFGHTLYFSHVDVSSFGILNFGWDDPEHTCSHTKLCRK